VNNGHIVNLTTTTAAEICKRFDLKQEARPLLRDGMGPREFLEALVANRQSIAGIDFMAHALPAREAVWWGCLCLQHACGNSLSLADKEACKAAVIWVLEPTEENRAATKVRCEAAGRGGAAGELAAAANQTGGNLAPAMAPPMPPGPFVPAKAVAGAVKLAAIKVDPVKIVDTYRLFVELGIGVAEGRFVWSAVRNGAAPRR
jgi:hypothetical protein